MQTKLYIKNIVASLLFVLGSMLMSFGYEATTEAQSALISENITIPEDGAYAGEQVRGILTAIDMAEVIQKHTLEATGGKTYAEMERDDPQRELYTRAVVLRTSLFAGAMAMGVGLLTVAVGILAFVLAWLVFVHANGYDDE